MHVTFVPLTEDNRLSAKEIIGNKAKLSQWQSDYWTHMVGKYPDLERGESADKDRPQACSAACIQRNDPSCQAKQENRSGYG